MAEEEGPSSLLTLAIFDYDSAVGKPNKKLKLTSPRSIAACQELGLSSADLTFKSKQEFQREAKPGEAPLLIEKRAELHEQQRQHLLKQAKIARRKLVMQHQNHRHPETNLPTSNTKLSATSNVSTMLQRENEQLVRMKERQAAEMAQMYNLEAQRAKLHEEKERRRVREQQAEQDAKAKQVAKAREWERQRREQERAKAEKAEREETRLRQEAAKAHALALARVEEEKLKLKRRQAQMRKEERIKLAKAEASRKLLEKEKAEILAERERKVRLVVAMICTNAL